MNFRSRLLATTLAASVLAIVPAHAQTGPGPDSGTGTPTNNIDQNATGEPAEGGEIVVTGSRIARRDLETAAPIAVVGQEEFKLSGTVNVEQVINTLPQVIPGSTAFSNNPGGGVSTLNLRGLGENRTLVLVNGRRWMFYDASQITDLNTIPAFLLEGVDVVTGGASAVYGSDALAGVVNFRLRTDLSGVEAGGQYGLTERGDGRRYEGYVALGTALADNRGHATVYAEYFRREAIFQGARSYSREALGDNGDGSALIPGGSSTTPTARLTSTYGAACPTGNIFCGGGAFFTEPGVSRPRVATDLYNFAPANYLQVPQERYLLGGYADYDMGGGNTAYVEASFVNNRVANELAATPVTGTFQVNINAVSPFLSAANIAALRQLDTVAIAANTVLGDGIVPLSVQRRVLETGGRNSLDERNAFRMLVGVKGPIAEGFNYDAYYSYARTRNANVQAGNISRAAFQAGLNGSADAINIFGPGTLTPAMVDQISIVAQNGDISVLQVANASVSGGLFNLGLGGGDVSIAAGGEYRKLSAEFIPDTALSSGDVIGFNAGDATIGSYNVKEVFGELLIPVAARIPGVYNLELTAAGRYSDYSLGNVGGVWTYAGGATYSPIRDITFRGQYQRAVRAPNVAELFAGGAVNFPQAQDPCALASAAANATIRGLCVATGVPTNLVGTPGLQINNQIQIQTGGNPNLQEEVSDSYTAGVVLRPSFLPGLSMTADYFNLKVENTVSSLGGGLVNTLDLCYNVLQDISSPYCQAFVGTRNALGQFDGTVLPLIGTANVSTLKAEGVDVQVDYQTRFPLSMMGRDDSRLAFFFLGTYTRKSDLTPVAEQPDIVTKCAGTFGLTCGNPTPKYKWTSRVSWIDGGLTTSLRWRHLSAVRDDDDTSDFFVERIPAYNLVDLSFSFNITDQYNLSIGVNNLFDKNPTVLGSNQQQANTFPGTYDVLGRDFFVSTRFKF
ncbi:TonB-dependent receptor [Microvirga sp. SRT01]|uniref:TonB-dependent receptor n=1 Tax=Sphingomonas longa TaxID=2778730 RepID=A0ABS2DBW5_9SPHN|nr:MULTISPECIES: TonB-dependent receptor [Alphaproteobacteria]MBM6578435.1 TonB-dependent receptor [Sphingomonas sp. BT552]MBR7711475.1 TonB-dependent receptor [Microvirga sp. SRT01]